MDDPNRDTTLTREDAADRLAAWVRGRASRIDQHWDERTLEWLASSPGADDRPPPMLLYELMLVLMDPAYTRWLTEEGGLAEQASAAESATLSSLLALTQRIRTRGITPGAQASAHDTSP